MCNRISNLHFCTVQITAREQSFVRSVFCSPISLQSWSTSETFWEKQRKGTFGVTRRREALQDTKQRISVVMCLSQLLLCWFLLREVFKFCHPVSLFLTLLYMLDFLFCLSLSLSVKTARFGIFFIILKQKFSCWYSFKIFILYVYRCFCFCF